MEVVFLSRFSKDLDAITDRDLKSAVIKRIAELELCSSLQEVHGIRKLEGHKHAYRLRIRNYRLAFYMEDDVIEIARFLNRKDIYKAFP